jgi:glycosyltransferase involved in cell wall biosynthesis
MKRLSVRILFVNEKCGYFGGVEQNVADTAEGLRSRGHICYLAYARVTEQDVNKYKALFEECFPCEEMIIGKKEEEGKSYEAILNQVKPDAIYLHKVNNLRFCEPFLSKVHTVRMVHDHDLYCPRRHKYFMIGNRVCYHRADWRCWLDGAFLAKDTPLRIGFTWVSIRDKLKEMRRNYQLDILLVGSRFMKGQLLQNSFPEEKIHILPPVIRLTCPSPAKVPDERNILYVGQLIRGKGVDLLLRALQTLSCRFTATLIGAGNARDELEALCRSLGLVDKVKFQGWVRHEALGSFYSTAKVVVVPSRWPEPFGMVGIEAMHYGRPVVAFNVGGISDWLLHEVTGLLVPEQDITALGRSLQRILTRKGLATKLGQNAYEYAQERYTFDSYIEQLESYLLGKICHRDTEGARG